ncbi:DUF642 domain-containing protein [Aeromonas bestiarum]|jgi:hypothetical protein|uniref:DUF642 domain-containing protein n=1 Tax=Aeromonas bestiarum TaxID=105751 RepID=UPI0005B7FC18|nr:DUF642 domain-containing protein [Aeromonas bestiarum]
MKNFLLILGIIFSNLVYANECDQLIVNGSFENSPARPSIWETLSGNDETSLPGWKTLGEGVEWSSHVSASGGSKIYTPDGDYVIDLNNYYSKNGGGIEQSFPTKIGSKYLVTFHAGTQKNYNRDGTAKLNVMIGDEHYVYNLKTERSDAIDWTYFSFSFVASQASTTIKFTTDTNSLEHFTVLDDVNVVPLNKPRAILVN